MSNSKLVWLALQVLAWFAFFWLFLFPLVGAEADDLRNPALIALAVVGAILAVVVGEFLSQDGELK